MGTVPVLMIIICVAIAMLYNKVLLKKTLKKMVVLRRRRSTIMELKYTEDQLKKLQETLKHEINKLRQQIERSRKKEIQKISIINHYIMLSWEMQRGLIVQFKCTTVEIANLDYLSRQNTLSATNIHFSL